MKQKTTMAKDGFKRRFPNSTTTYKFISVNGKQRFEHRVIMEQMLGRHLEKNEIVHHIDGNGLNNDPSNLQLMTKSEHAILHLGEKWPLNEGIAMREKGCSLAEIAKKYNITYQAVAYAFKKRGISTANLSWGKAGWPIDEAVELYKAGSRLIDLVRKYDRSAMTIRRALILRGVYRFPQTKPENAAAQMRRGV